LGEKTVRERFIDYKANVVANYRDLDAFLGLDSVPAGINSVTVNGIPIDLVNVDLGADTTVIIFHGAIEPGHTIPFLSGNGITHGLQANRVSISDPSLILSDKLALSWYAGNKDQQLQSILPKIIQKVLDSHGSKRVIFFGGSGGGFASLYFSTLFPESLAFVFNPQTNIERYLGRSVRDYATIAYGIADDEYNPLAEIEDRPVTDVLPIYSNPVPNTVLYLQNLNDPYHIDRHLDPFIKAKHPENRIFFHQDAWQDGHTPPPKEMLKDYLQKLAGPEPWETLVPMLAATRN
jgi:pimeloyl-ACP methyl ester carboxylesterase